jgi:hypothetical protein
VGIDGLAKRFVRSIYVDEWVCVVSFRAGTLGEVIRLVRRIALLCGVCLLCFGVHHSAVRTLARDAKATVKPAPKPAGSSKKNKLFTLPKGNAAFALLSDADSLAIRTHLKSHVTPRNVRAKYKEGNEALFLERGMVVRCGNGIDDTPISPSINAFVVCYVEAQLNMRHFLSAYGGGGVKNIGEVVGWGSELIGFAAGSYVVQLSRAQWFGSSDDVGGMFGKFIWYMTSFVVASAIAYGVRPFIDWMSKGISNMGKWVSESPSKNTFRYNLVLCLADPASSDQKKSCRSAYNKAFENKAPVVPVHNLYGTR